MPLWSENVFKDWANWPNSHCYDVGVELRDTHNYPWNLLCGHLSASFRHVALTFRPFRHFAPVISEYHKMDTKEYTNIFWCHIWYPSIFRCKEFTKQISKCICIPEIPQIKCELSLRVILFEYSNIRTHQWLKNFFKRAHSCFL